MKYRVTWEETVTTAWECFVEAEDETEAKELFVRGEVDGMSQTDMYGTDIEWDSIKVKED